MCPVSRGSSSEVTNMVFMTLFFQIKYAIPQNPNNIGLTFSPENQFRKSGKSRFLV